MKKFTIALLGLCLLCGIPAQAKGKWAAHHPWRAHDNQRLRNQNRRINQGLADGQLNRSQAHQLRQEDHSMRQEERTMAGQNHTHLTGKDQQALNQQLNSESSQIYQERH